jgi:hypothetical protein
MGSSPLRLYRCIGERSHGKPRLYGKKKIRGINRGYIEKKNWVGSGWLFSGV